MFKKSLRKSYFNRDSCVDPSRDDSNSRPTWLSDVIDSCVIQRPSRVQGGRETDREHTVRHGPSRRQVRAETVVRVFLLRRRQVVRDLEICGIRRAVPVVGPDERVPRTVENHTRPGQYAAAVRVTGRRRGDVLRIRVQPADHKYDRVVR